MLSPKNDSEEFDFYLKCAKPFILNLSDSTERITAAAWLKKLCQNEAGKLRTDYLKLLLYVLQRRRLIAPFTQMPDESPLESFPGGSNLQQMVQKVADTEQASWKDTFNNKDKKWPPYTTTCDEHLNQYAAMQEIPKFGIQAFFAISRDPLHMWENYEKAVLPQANKHTIKPIGFGIELDMSQNISCAVDAITVEDILEADKEIISKRHESFVATPQELAFLEATYSEQTLPPKAPSPPISPLIPSLPPPPIRSIARRSPVRSPDITAESEDLEATPEVAEAIPDMPTKTYKDPCVKPLPHILHPPKKTRIPVKKSSERVDLVPRLPPKWGSNLISVHEHDKATTGEASELSIQANLSTVGGTDSLLSQEAGRKPSSLKTPPSKKLPTEEDYKDILEDVELLQSSLPVTTPERTVVPKRPKDTSK